MYSELDVERFYLPKGTIVKHGTSLCRVEEILASGIKSDAERTEKRIRDELAPEVSGVYIGNLLSYFSAYAAYSSIMTSVWNMPEYLKVRAHLFDNPMKIITLGLPEIPLTLPIVLNIQLEEDCLLYADEDFVSDGRVPVGQIIPEGILASEAKMVWDKWQSGCIVGRDGIPAEWIKDIEFPRLGSLQGNGCLHKHTMSDCDLFALGTLQAALKKLPGPLLESFKKNHNRVTLSQRISATKEGLAQLKGLQGLSNTSNQFFNHAHIQQFYEHLADQYRIPLHR